MASYGAAKIGPFGGDGGDGWEFPGDGRYGLRRIVIRAGDYIDSVVFTFLDRVTRRGDAVVKAGGTGGSNRYEINIDLFDGVNGTEHVKSIGGTISNGYIESLTFVTNKTTYGPYGRTTGTPFSVPVEDGEIYGVYGRNGQYLDKIGFFLAAPFAILRKEGGA